VAHAFVTAAVAICIVLFTVVSLPSGRQTSVVYTATYLDTLYDHDAEPVAYMEAAYDSSEGPAR
jgi:hypothetical protein